VQLESGSEVVDEETREVEEALLEVEGHSVLVEAPPEAEAHLVEVAEVLPGVEAEAEVSQADEDSQEAVGSAQEVVGEDDDRLKDGSSFLFQHDTGVEENTPGESVLRTMDRPRVGMLMHTDGPVGFPALQGRVLEDGLPGA